MAAAYPKFKYHPDYEPIIVTCQDEEDELDGWYDNPTEYGVSTTPSAQETRFVPKQY